MLRPRTRYYTLVASLPALPRIRRAERLPINQPRLESRLRMLTPEDAEVVEHLRRFIHWENHPPGEADAEVAAQYRKLLETNPHPAVRAAIEFRIDLRTVLAALRRRRSGQTEPPCGQDWGLSGWVRHIEANWKDPDFKLAHVFPWIPEVRRLLEEGKALQLEELVMNLVWDALDRSALGKYFELENVVAYLFKWNMLSRWLSYQEDSARMNFEALAANLFPGENGAPQKSPP